MHILITLITAFAGLIWALYRLQNSGVDLNSFNPFYWARRRRWQKLHGTKAIHRLENPIEAASTILVSALTLRGEVTLEEKQALISIFENDLHMSAKEAQEAYSYASHLLKDVVDIKQELRTILACSIEKFNQAQKRSLIELTQKTIQLHGEASNKQLELLEELKTVMATQ